MKTYYIMLGIQLKICCKVVFCLSYDRIVDVKAHYRTGNISHLGLVLVIFGTRRGR